MGVLYAWATKEYLLEHMTFGQIVMYYNDGMEFKYPKPRGTSGPRSARNNTNAENRAEKERLLKQYGLKGDG